jgi:hypothetical protein
MIVLWGSPMIIGCCSGAGANALALDREHRSEAGTSRAPSGDRDPNSQRYQLDWSVQHGGNS